MAEGLEGTEAAALRCIEIIQHRTPITPQEERLLARMINDIRLEFNLDGAVLDLVSDAGEETPAAWFW